MTLKKGKLLTLSLLATLILAGCTNNNGNVPFSFHVWTAYSTNKVIQQTYRNDSFINTGGTLKIKMMRDEYESSQLIITANKKAYFDLIKSELVDSKTGNKIPLENIEIYVQKYMELEMIFHNSGDGYYSSGDKVPDMLLPLEYAKNKAENFVAPNSNQGISIEIDSNGLPAGIYTGNFTLKIGENTQQIPVEVTIWDFALEGKSSIQSCWLIYSMYMMTGEYDASRNMLNTYADFLSKYKANPYIIQEASMNSPEALLQDVERMWSIKNFNTITIPYDFPLNYNPDSQQGETAANFIVKLAEKSTEEHFYLDYAIFYPSTYDEADAFAKKKEATPSFFEENGRYQQTLEKAIQILSNKGYFLNHEDSWNNRVKTAIRNIPNVFTNCNYIDNWVREYPTTFCPKENVLDSQKIREAYKDYANKNANGNLWTYTCVDPNYPYPSHHIDDDCLSMRVLGWMEKAYQVNGYLFFMANMYTTENKASDYTTPYTVPNRTGHSNGDGFIMYPGRWYGSSTPFPSMRLVTYRDGLEDYDMLEVYERKIAKMCEKYHISDFDVKDYVNDIYSSLFKDAVPTEDHDALYNAREKLAQRILSVDNPDDFFTRISNDEGKINLHIYANRNDLTIDNNKVTMEQIEENSYHFSVELGKDKKTINMKIGENSYSYDNPGYLNLTNFIGSTPSIETSESSTYEVNSGAISAHIVSMERETINKTIRFVPYISIKNINLVNAKKIMFEYSNDSLTDDLLFDVDLISNVATYTVGGHFCIANGAKTIEINLSSRNIDLSKVTGVRLSFMNYYFNEAGELCIYEPRDISFKDIYAMY